MSDESKKPSLFQLWFGLTERVDRKAYVLTGVGLMLLKYVVDILLVYLDSGNFLMPWQYLSPVFAHRQDKMDPVSGPPMALLMVAWTLPFLWVGLSMSVRRAQDAGWSPWLGLLFVTPVINYVLMLVLALLPSAPLTEPSTQSSQHARDETVIKSALKGMAVGFGIASLVTLISVFILGEYGAVLFALTPLVMGAASAWIFNRGHMRTLKATLVVALLTVVFVGGAMVLFALEGFICIMMASVPAVIMAWFGAVIGRAMALANSGSKNGLVMLILCLPLMAAAEPTKAPSQEIYETVTTIEIDAPPEKVWPNVIGFSELPPPSRFLFELGIAYPMRARIEGSGVGAVRHCEFSTGAFVEPITTWDEPNRLSFDVTSQPPPMTELSPYKNLHPPHIDSYIRSRRGEFRLVALPGGRTRLEGSTFYELEIFPQSYWTFWSNALIHGIHNRVLEHIKNLSETPG